MDSENYNYIKYYEKINHGVKYLGCEKIYAERYIVNTLQKALKNYCAPTIKTHSITL